MLSLRTLSKLHRHGIPDYCDISNDAANAFIARWESNKVFERPVTFYEAGKRVGHGFMGLYKRGCFILEAKQSRVPGAKKEIIGQRQEELFESGTRGRRGGERGWDDLMMNARKQAEDYAQALLAMHDWPPFILVCDVGHVIEVFADFTGKGRNYTQFPDRQEFVFIWRIFGDRKSASGSRKSGLRRMIWILARYLAAEKCLAESFRLHQSGFPKVLRLPY